MNYSIEINNFVNYASHVKLSEYSRLRLMQCFRNNFLISINYIQIVGIKMPSYLRFKYCIKKFLRAIGQIVSLNFRFCNQTQ